MARGRPKSLRAIEDFKQLKFPHQNPRVTPRCLDPTSVKKIQQTLTQIDFVNYTHQEEDLDLESIEETRPRKRRKLKTRKPADPKVAAEAPEKTGLVAPKGESDNRGLVLESNISSARASAARRAPRSPHTPRMARIEICSSQSPLASPLSAASPKSKLNRPISPLKASSPKPIRPRMPPSCSDLQAAQDVEIQDENREFDVDTSAEGTRSLSATAARQTHIMESGIDMREIQQERRNAHLVRPVVQSRGTRRTKYSGALLEVLDSDSEAEEDQNLDEHSDQKDLVVHETGTGFGAGDNSEALPFELARTEAIVEEIPPSSPASLATTTSQISLNQPSDLDLASEQLRADLNQQTQIDQSLKDPPQERVFKTSSANQDRHLHCDSRPSQRVARTTATSDKLDILPSSQATTVDVTQPSPRHVLSPSPRSPPLLLPASQSTVELFSPAHTGLEADVVADGARWNDLLLTDSQMLPESILTFSPPRPPLMLLETRESWHDATSGG